MFAHVKVVKGRLELFDVNLLPRFLVVLFLEDFVLNKKSVQVCVLLRTFLIELGCLVQKLVVRKLLNLSVSAIVHA